MGAATYPPPPIDPRIVPQPPRLHWAVVLVLSILTRTFFGEIWLVVQANWIRKLTGRTEPLTWTIVSLCTLPVVIVSAILFGIGIAALGADRILQTLVQILAAATGIAVFALYVVAVFKVRAALEAEPIGLPLSGIMSFFFGAIYFQYFLHDFVMRDPADVWGPLPPSPAYVPATWPAAEP